MKYLNRFFGALLAFLFCSVSLNAQTTTFDVLTDVAGEAEIFFGIVVALAVLVTGFFLGRKWMRSV